MNVKKRIKKLRKIKLERMTLKKEIMEERKEKNLKKCD